MRRQQITLLSAIVLCAATAVYASNDIPRYVIAAGGVSAVSTHYAIQGTLGQPVVGLANSAHYQIMAGYWPGAMHPPGIWCDNFDSYAVGPVTGQGGWQGWDGNPAAGALVSNALAHSAPNSVAIVGASDLVHTFSSVDSGRWVFKAWQYVPTDFVSHCDGSGNCGSYFMVLNTYQDGGPYSWTVQLRADSITNALVRDDAPSASLPLIHGSWAEIKTVFDLDQDWFRVFYNGTELGTQASWTADFAGQTTPGVLNLGALDLYANQSTVVYYDDICLTPVVQLPGDLNCDGVVNFDDINAFVLALSDPAGYANAYPDCYLLNGDCNGDGVVNFDDINPFVDILSGG